MTTDTTRFYHNPDYRIIPDAIIKRATAKFKQKLSQPKPHKFRTVDVAGNKFVRVAFSSQLTRAG